MPIGSIRESFREETDLVMDVLEHKDAWNARKARLFVHFAFSSTQSPFASDKAVPTVIRFERQHIRSNGFARPHGCCRSGFTRLTRMVGT
jgi:hypothetical protein